MKSSAGPVPIRRAPGLKGNRHNQTAPLQKPNMKRTRRTQNGTVVPDDAFKYLLLTALLLVVILHLLAAYWATPYLWGVHHLHFFPGWLRWILTLVVMAVFIPHVNRLSADFFESAFGSLKKTLARFGKYRLFAAAGLASLPLFWFLRTKLFLLGDGYFILGILPEGQMPPTELLDRIVHHHFFRLLDGIFPGVDPSFSYVIPSVIGGGIFIFLILTLSDFLGKGGIQKILIFSALATLGSVELFFGYVESYTLLLLSLTLYVLFSILHLRGKTSVIPPLLALVLSIALHLLAVVLIPSFVYAILWKWRKGERKLLRLSNILSFLACLGIICWIVWRFFLVRFEGVGYSGLLPLLPSAETGFTLFSGAHLGELANLLLLISPVGLMLCLFFAFQTSRYRAFKDPILNFLLISSLSGLLLVFVYDFHWGNADWDLMSFPGMFLTLWGILLFVKVGSRWPNFRNYALILITVGLFHIIPWILVNAGTQMSVDRYVMTATNDKHLLGAKGGGMWRVARILEAAGFPGKAEELLKLGIKRNPQELGCYSYLGKMLYSQGRYDEAKFHLERALQLKPDSPEVQFNLGRVYLRTDDLQKAILQLEQAKEEYGDDQVFVITLSKAYLGVGRPKDAQTLLSDFLATNEESATMRGLLGTSFYLQKDFSNAKRDWERALQLDPNEPLAKTGLEQLRRITEE